MNPVSFITANFVARELNYRMTDGWMQGDTATQQHFQPLATFAPRFEAMLKEIAAMGFDRLDLWGAHLHPNWATDEHLRQAKQLLQANGLRVSSLAAWCGSLSDVEGFCRVAVGLGADLIAGGAPVLATDRLETVALLKTHGLRLGLENHPEKSAGEVLERIGDGADGAVGAACDTGWWATQGASAPEALRELRDHLMTVHLKDILAAGAHETCRFGTGIADIQACARALQEIGYQGVIGIEHEPETHDPTEDVIASKRLLETWLGGKR